MTTVAPVAVPFTDPSGNPVTGKINCCSFFYHNKIYWYLLAVNIYSISFTDASGNPVTETVISVTDSSGNLVTGYLFSFKPCSHYKIFTLFKPFI